jgi:hypothetical protein
MGPILTFDKSFLEMLKPSEIDELDLQADRPSLGDLTGRVTDFNGAGEISPTGSISWSDSSHFKQLAQGVGYPAS